MAVGLAVLVGDVIGVAVADDVGAGPGVGLGVAVGALVVPPPFPCPTNFCTSPFRSATLNCRRKPSVGVTA
jgi:hypothetical protein